MGDQTSEIVDIARLQDSQREQRLYERLAASAERVSIPPFTVRPDCKAVLPESLVRRHGLVPIGFEGTVPIIAMADVADSVAMQAVRRLLPNCRFVRSPLSQVKRTIDEIYW